MNLPTQQENSPKLVRAEDLRTQLFDYKKLHDEALSQLYFAQEHDLTANQFFDNPSVSPLVKKVICGGMYPSAIKNLVQNYGLRIKSEQLTVEAVMENYSKVILAVDFPEIEPVVYLKPRKQRQYLKMVPASTGGFKYERPTPPRVGFYLWLETVKPGLGSERMESVLEYCASELTAFPKTGKPERQPDPVNMPKPKKGKGKKRSRPNVARTADNQQARSQTEQSAEQVNRKVSSGNRKKSRKNRQKPHTPVLDKQE